MSHVFFQTNRRSLFRLVTTHDAQCHTMSVGAVVCRQIRDDQPRLHAHTQSQLYVLQAISVAGIGIAGLHDLRHAVKSNPSTENKASLLDSCILSIVYTAPFVTVRNDAVTTEEYNVSVYIALTYFGSSIVACLGAGIGVRQQSQSGRILQAV